MSNEWEFFIYFTSYYDQGEISGTANFSASTNQYLNCHFYPNNTAGQSVVKMELTTNSNTIYTVVWIETAFQSANLGNYHLLNAYKIECIYSLDGRKVDQILTNLYEFIRYKSVIVSKYHKID